MIVFLLALSVICVLTGACQTPQCTVKNDSKAPCTVERKDLTRINDIKRGAESREVSIIIYNTSFLETNASWKITSKVVRKGRTKKYSMTIFDIHQANLPWKYVVTIKNFKKNAKTDLDIFLSCLAYSNQSGNVTAELRFRHPFDRQLKKKHNTKYQRNRNRSTKEITRRGELLPSTRPTQHTSKESPETANQNQCEAQNNCTVNLQTKTIQFWCQKPKHNIVTKCGIMSASGELITGQFSEDTLMGFCSTTYNKTELYYTRMYFSGGKGSSQCKHIEIDIRSMQAKHVRMMQRNEESIDTRQTVVLVFLFSALIPLTVFVIVLYCSRRKLKHVIKVKTDDFFSPIEQTDPRVMIVTVDEYDTDISQLVDLLVGEKINVVTLASHAQENMLSRHDWLELTVNECNHFIFIVTKQMEETLNMLNKKWSIDNCGGREGDLLIDYERGTCAYTIALIRNKFIKSLKCSGKFVESCHLVSFEDIDIKNVLNPAHGRELFPCIKTHHYCLYSKQRFQFHHARRIIRNIMKIEKHRPKGNSKHEKSTKRSSNEGMDIEKAFVSMNLYSNPNVIPDIQIENESDIDTDFDDACDLLIENLDRPETA